MTDKHDTETGTDGHCIEAVGFSFPDDTETTRCPAVSAFEVEGEIEGLRRQRNELMHERDTLMEMRNALMRERNGLIGERDALMRDRDALMASAQVAPQADRAVTWIRIADAQAPRFVGVNVDGAHGGQVVQLVESLIGFRPQGEDLPPPDCAGSDSSPELLLIGGHTGADGRFDPAGGRVRFRLPSTTSNGFHPIVLADVLSTNLAGNVVACGYPGSGNGVVQAALEAMLANRPIRPHAGTALLSAFAADYRRLTTEVLADLDVALGAEQHEIATYRDGLASVGWSWRDDRSVLFGLPLRTHLCESVHKTHGPYSPHMAGLVRSGARCVLVMRNPLDTVVSIARKAGAVLDVLNCEWLLRSVAAGLAAYYTSFREAVAIGAVTVIRYEDCAADFGSALQNVARACDLDLDASSATRMASTLWNRPVSGPGHLWLPGVGKWKDYLGRRHLALLLEAGIGDVMTQLQYPIPDISDVPERPERFIAPQRVAPVKSSLAFFSHCCRSLEEAVDAFDRAGAEVNVRRWNGLHFVSTAAHALDSFAEFAERGPLRELLARGRLDNRNPSASAPMIFDHGPPISYSEAVCHESK